MRKWLIWWTYRELNPELGNANAALYRLTISPDYILANIK